MGQLYERFGVIVWKNELFVLVIFTRILILAANCDSLTRRVDNGIRVTPEIPVSMTLVACFKQYFKR
jgi:hypothetical protein